jgi:hypothetical protein
MVPVPISYSFLFRRKGSHVSIDLRGTFDMIPGYENYYDWLIKARESNLTVAPWLAGFTQWVNHRDYSYLVASHPGYLIKLTADHFYCIAAECWITNWAKEHIKDHHDGTEAFAVIPVSNFGLVRLKHEYGLITTNRDRAAAHYPEVRRVLFDRAEDAALFKLTFLDKITPVIHKVNYEEKL